ncbi:sensor histidine kinase [Paenibacillus bovis]|uniref:histidine kinase n=1 Tax=Paenibacillus bovis TaxID=1616788 RepID=A0A172ZIA3_9BACL|nr:histidine kinase [Paenibacillus bovis]ANF97371.1 hypothetical protein AR543_16080 [Paenibacillus bovis]
MKSANVGSALHCKTKQNQRSQKKYADIPVIPHAAIDEQTIPLGLSASSHSFPNKQADFHYCTSPVQYPSTLLTEQWITEQLLTEERRRIARDIHNVVSHTLTISVIQLDIAQKLLDINPTVTREKLESSQELIRHGIEEIRRFIHHMASQTPSMNLTSEIALIINNIYKHTSIEIDCAVGSLPELAYSQQKLICQALQEGITNGIRHGRSGCFRFWLHQQNEQIVFKLANKGSCPSKVHFGFGLSTLQQRVEDGGGTLNLCSNTPDWTQLFIQMPICNAAGEAYE